MLGTVTAVNKSKSGKAFRVTINGKVYNAFLDSNIDKAVGKVIDAQITPDKGFGEGIGQWAYSTQTEPPKPANTAPEASGRATDGELRFISNCVGQAIAAKTITDPLQIGAWTKAAAAAVKEV